MSSVGRAWTKEDEEGWEGGCLVTDSPASEITTNIYGNASCIDSNYGIRSRDASSEEGTDKLKIRR